MRHVVAVALCSLALTPAAEAGSPCSVGYTSASCAYSSTTLSTGSSGAVEREVHWALPTGAAPADGWPVVLVFQGSFMPAENTFDSQYWYPYGAFYLTQLADALLDAGYAVIAPEAASNGSTFWQTNIPPYATNWWASTDAWLVSDILDGVAAGDFGDLDASRQFATGISSGGYMTSRMATDYPGEFQALAIQSGSYATCIAYTCAVPTLPSDHPPTLFLNGYYDNVVPYYTVDAYMDQMDDQGLVWEESFDWWRGHQWGPDAVSDIPAWFDQH